jgi:adenine/guanine phosphoribosyltransferase-like PRPP-binding protein
MTPEQFWQTLHPPSSFPQAGAHAGFYPATFDDGRQVLLPVRELPGGERAVASLIINQASFAVLDAIAEDLTGKLLGFAPDVVVGLPTLGLTLAAAVARRLGHSRYIPLGTSKKFWYRDDLAVPLTSITSPEGGKRLYIDPRMTPLLHGARIALVDDVISTGASLAAGIALLGLCGVKPVCVGTAMIQSRRWEGRDFGLKAGQILTVLRTPMLVRSADGWLPE